MGTHACCCVLDGIEARLGSVVVSSSAIHLRGVACRWVVTVFDFSPLPGFPPLPCVHVTFVACTLAACAAMLPAALGTAEVLCLCGLLSASPMQTVVCADSQLPA
jgi:hypothetical protein